MEYKTQKVEKSITVPKPNPVQEIRNENQLREFLKDFPKTHKIFADKYLETFNQEEAFKLAYPDSKPKNLAQACYDVLSRPKVQAYLQYRFKLRQLKSEVTVNNLLRDLIKIRDDNLKPTQNDRERRANQYLAIKAIEQISTLLGITKTQAQTINFNQINNYNNQIIVKTFVVPAFKSTITPPEVDQNDITKLVEEYIKERKE